MLACGHVPHLDRVIRSGGGDPRAITAKGHAREGGVPLDGLMPRPELALPVVPFEAATIDTFLVLRTLVVEASYEERRIPVLPRSLRHLHLHVIEPTVGQLRLVPGDLGLSLGVDSRHNRLAPLPDDTGQPQESRPYH